MAVTKQAMFEIIPYQSSDLPVLTQFVEAIQEHERIAIRELKPGTEIGTVYAKMLLHKVSSQNGCILLAKADGRSIGFVCGWTEVDEDVLLREDMRAHAYISDIFVVEDWRGKGVAPVLLAEVEAVMRRRGCARVRVCAKAANTLAVSCYTRTGYTPYEIVFSKPLACGANGQA